MEEEIRNEPLISNPDDYHDLNTDVTKKEKERFTKYSPLVTLLIMSIGPASLLVQAIGETLDMFQISKRYADEPNSHAVEMIGFSATIFQTVLYIGYFFGQGLTARVTTLIGHGERDVAAHLVVDIFRIGFVSSIFFAVGFIYAVKPFLTFVGCPESMLDDTFHFILPIIIASPFVTVFNIAINFLQCIGNSILSAAMKSLAYLFQCGVFTPLLLFAFKIPTSLIKLSIILSQSTMGIILVILMFKGKYSLKPNYKLLFGKFCKETPKALLLASPMLFQFLCFVLPPTLILQCLTTVAPNYSREIGGVFAVLSRINGLAVAFPSSIGTGYLSSGTLAFGSGDIRRLVSLMLWGILIAFTLTFIWTPVVVRNPRTVASLFLDDNNELQLAEQLLPIPFYTISLSGIGLVIVMTQLVAGKPIFALLPSLFQLLIQSFGCKFLAKKYSDHLINVMYIYNISDISVFVLNMLLFIYPVVVIRRKLKANNESSILTSLNTTDQPYETFQ